MGSRELTLEESSRVTSVRRLLLIWQNPKSQRFVRVGELDELADGRMAFSYLPGATADPDFFPLDEFPDRSRSYVSDGFPAFFANRVMSTRRVSYGAYRGWLGLDAAGADVPVEVLARTGGPRATDTFHVVDLPGVTEGRFESRFFVSGIRHVPGAAERLRTLQVGSELGLRDEPENPVNPEAVLVDAHQGLPVGWVPDWLVGELHILRDQGHRLRCSVERINVDAPPHLQLLVKITSDQS
jgi:hypothetical protein